MASTISAFGNSERNEAPGKSRKRSSQVQKAFHEGGHLLEKLEFALAIAETNGDQARSDSLRAQIADLGGNIEEPGT